MMNAQETADMTEHMLECFTQDRYPNSFEYTELIRMRADFRAWIEAIKYHTLQEAMNSTEFWEELGKEQHCKGCSCFEKPVDTELTLDEQLEYLRQKLTRGDLHEQD